MLPTGEDICAIQDVDGYKTWVDWATGLHNTVVQHPYVNGQTDGRLSKTSMALAIALSMS